MQLILVNCAIVLVTQEHVASINHDFLVNKNIIPENFQKKANSFNTAVVSEIHYNNGFSIKVEPNKTCFLFFNQNVSESSNLNNLNRLKTLSSKYVEFFNINNYQAIGINFDFIREDLKYHSFIGKLIKKDSPFLSFENNKGEVSNINLSYHIRGKQINITVWKLKRKSNRTSSYDFVPYFKVNGHYPNSYTDSAINVIEELEENYEKTQKFIKGF